MKEQANQGQPVLFRGRPEGSNYGNNGLASPEVDIEAVRRIIKDANKKPLIRRKSNRVRNLERKWREGRLR